MVTSHQFENDINLYDMNLIFKYKTNCEILVMMFFRFFLGMFGEQIFTNFEMNCLRFTINHSSL